jgi:hypothetical protein
VADPLSPELSDLALMIAMDPRYRLQLPLNPYHGLPLADPLRFYGFDPNEPKQEVPVDPDMQGGIDIYEHLSGIEPHFDESLQGNVEQRGQADPMALLSSSLSAQSQGKAPPDPTNPRFQMTLPGRLPQDLGMSDLLSLIQRLPIPPMDATP